MMITCATVFSCVNPDYDLSKGIDMDLTLLPNTALPLGSLGQISVTDLLGSEESDGLVIAENGDISFSLGGGELSAAYDMPSVDMGGEGGLSSGNTTVRFKTGIEVPEIPDILSEEVIHFSEIEQDDMQGEGDLFETHMPIEIDKEIPKQIIDIKSLDMENAILRYNFEVSEGAIVHINKGFILEFPHYMILDNIKKDSRYELHDNYIVEFKEDVMLSHDSPLTLEFWFRSVHGHEYDENGNVTVDLLDFSPLYDELGNVRATRLYHVDQLGIKGDLYLKFKDYAQAQMYIPSELSVLMSVDMVNLNMTTAEMKLDLNMEVDPQTVDLSGMSGFLAQENMVIDLYNPALMLTISNSTPMEMNVNVDVTSHKDSKEKTVHIGDKETDPIVIPASGEEVYCISQRGNEPGNDAVEVVVEDFGALIKEMPQMLEIHNVEIEAADEFVKVYSDSHFALDIEYGFSAPLAFGEDLAVSFTYDLPLGMEESLNLGSFLLSMNMENSIPLDFQVYGAALDADGNEIKDAAVDIDAVIKGGSLENPAVTKFETSVNTNSSSAVSALRLYLEASVPEGLAGECINTAQCLKMSDMVVSLPDGITLDLTSDEEK